MLEKLFESLGTKYQVKIQHKGVGVHTLELAGFDLEFSSPRIEIFKEGDLSHLNFVPKFVSNLSTLEAFRRRDFTINAIGIFFGVSGADDEFTVLDPYHGMQDLQEKKMREVSSDFFHDPVRLLRLIRFSERFNFAIDEKLKNNIFQFNLSKLSLFHFYSEFKKSRSIKFFKLFFELVSEHHITLAEDIEELSFLRELVDIKTSDRAELFFALQPFTDTQKSLITSAFKFKEKVFKGHLKTYKVLNEIREKKVVSLEILRSFEIIRDNGFAQAFGIENDDKYEKFLTLSALKVSFKSSSDRIDYNEQILKELNRQNNPK